MLGNQSNNSSSRRRPARSSGVPNARRCCACWGGSEAERNKKRFFDTGVARLLLASRNDAQRLALLITPVIHVIHPAVLECTDILGIITVHDSKAHSRCN